MLHTKKALAALLAATTGLSSLALGAVSATPVQAADDTVKILSLGDSITDGYWTSGAYRKYMYRDLELMGYNNIDMVGPKGSNSSTFTYNGETVSYDDNNAGYSGYAIQAMSSKEYRSGILETIQGTYYNGKNMIASYEPDIVLLQIGTNDILSDYNDGITDRLENLVNVILEDMDEDGVVFVSTIPDIDAVLRADWLGAYGISAWGSTDEEKQQLMETVTDCIDAYNTSIYNLVLEMQSEGKSVRFADINSVVDYQTDLYDGVHPNEAGYENMGDYWAGLLDSYFQETGLDQPSETTPATTTEAAVTTTTTKATTTATTTKATTTTTKATTTTAKATTTTANATTTAATTTKVTVPADASEIHLTDVSIGETYSLADYSNISAVSFVFSGEHKYGMNGCVAFGNWERNQNYTQDDVTDNVLTISLDKDYSSLTLYKWYGDADLSEVILYCGDTTEAVTTAAATTTTKATTTTTTTTTAKPTTTTTTTTTTAKPTTTTTTTTTTTQPTTTTTKATTTTTKATTTTAKPTTTTTKATTTTTKATTTTTKATTTTAKATTTTAKATTTTAQVTTTVASASNQVVLTDVEFNKDYSLADYNPSEIKEIVLELDGSVGYGFGGKFVFGSWASQSDFSAADLSADNTITIKATNPQDMIHIYLYWGSMSLKSVTLVY
jgi:lysophospholipase L1-like esterase